jgi:hypothetical protein
MLDMLTQCHMCALLYPYPHLQSQGATRGWTSPRSAGSTRSLLLPVSNLSGLAQGQGGLSHSGGGSRGVVVVGTSTSSPRVTYSVHHLGGPSHPRGGSGSSARHLHHALRPASSADIHRLASVGSLPSVAEEEGESGVGWGEGGSRSGVRGQSVLKRSTAAGDEGEQEGAG